MFARRHTAFSLPILLLLVSPVLAGCSHPAVPTEILEGVVDDQPTSIAVSDGDLWPNCWSDDDALYAANGDGAGFGARSSDIVLSRIVGNPDQENLSGESLAFGDQLGRVWAGEGFTRKPTGMLCVGGSIYLVVQDLASDFNEAPNAMIARSDDHGETWMWNAHEPMFSRSTFTTIWFADYGKDSRDSIDPDYAYAFGLDGNWRDSYTDVVADPTEMFLARVPVGSVQDIGTWQFYAGKPGDVKPTWSHDILEKRPVLVDERRVLPEHSADGRGYSVLSQGGVTYLPKSQRYVYTSWTEHTFEFYEAPQPWGPWRLFLSESFGPYPWTANRLGGYGTTVPSKYVSEDGLDMWLQSNVCPCAPAGVSSYWFGLRPLKLQLVND